MKYSFGSDLLEGFDRKRCGDIVRESQIDPHIEEFTRGDRLFARVSRKDLFGNGHWMFYLHSLFYVETWDVEDS